MSRTIRIKNNLRKFDKYKLSDVGVNKFYDWDYQFIPGEELGKDPNYKYLTAIEKTDKQSIWKAERWLHGDGKAYYQYGGKAGRYSHARFNKQDRRHASINLKHLVKIGAEDVVLDDKTRIPMNYY